MEHNKSYLDYTYPDRMHYIPIKDKNKQWVSDMLKYISYNSEPFVDQDEMAESRYFESGGRDEEAAKLIVDPPTEGKNNGGKAKHFASNFHANTIYVHLCNIIDAKMAQSTKDIKIKCIDKYALSKKMKENRKILERGTMIEIINEYNRQLNIPLLDKGADPYKYIEEEEARLAEADKKIMEGESPESETKAPAKNVDERVSSKPVGVVDYIKELVDDNEGLSLYNTYIYKDDISIPLELGIKYYTEQSNITAIEERVHKDLRHANAIALRFYTSEINGDPIMQYARPEHLYTNPMEKDDYDCRGFEYGFLDMSITFGEFMKTIGAKLSQDELEKVFEANRRSSSSLDSHKKYRDYSRTEIEFTRITIRYTEFITQNVEVYSEGRNRSGNYRLREAKFNFKNVEGSKIKRVEKDYNVWYYAYSIPSESAMSGQSLSTENQIIDWGLLQDQQRYGDNQRFAKSSFILYRKSDKVPITKIMREYMDELNPLWDKVKNDIRQAMPHGTLFNTNALQGMLEILEVTKNPTAAMEELIRGIKQTGSGSLPERSAKGDPYTWVVKDVKTGHIASALEKLTMFNNIYQQLKQALGINDAAEGIDPKPRQGLGGIKIATEAGNNSRHHLTESKDYMLEEMGYRYIKHFAWLVQEGGKRFQDFAEIIGYANELEIQTLKDIPLHRVGLYVDHRDDSQMSEIINNLIVEMSKTGQIDIDTALFVVGVENINYKYALLRLERKKRERMQEEAQMNQMQQAEAAEQRRIQNEQFMAQMRMQEYEHKKQTDLKYESALASIKTGSQKEIKEEITKGRKEEDTHKAKLELNKAKAIAESEIMGSEPNIEGLEAPVGEQQMPQEQLAPEQLLNPQPIDGI